MKKEIISCKKNENGSCSKKEKIIQEPDDGFVMFNAQNAVVFWSLGIFLLGGIVFSVYCCYHCLKRIRQIEIELYQKKKNKQNKDIIS